DRLVAGGGDAAGRNLAGFARALVGERADLGRALRHDLEEIVRGGGDGARRLRQRRLGGRLGLLGARLGGRRRALGRRGGRLRLRGGGALGGGGGAAGGRLLRRGLRRRRLRSGGRFGGRLLR